MNDQGTIRIAPSLLSADFARLAEDLERVEAAGCEIVHLDVMDGHFVPNISFGPGVCAAVRRATGLFLDAHLMIDDPGFYLQAFVDAGVDEITVHPEIEGDYRGVLAAIGEKGVRAGVALRPATPVETVRDALPLIDHLLIMSVEPGFGGQAFQPSSLEKLRTAAAMIAASGRAVDLGVDGGINPATAPLAVAAGARRLIAGSAVFGGNVEENVAALLAAAGGNRR